MSRPVPLPLALRVVALIFFFSGINSVITIVLALLHNSIQVDFGVLGIFVYFGLHRLSNGWRKCALVLLWIGIIFAMIISACSFVAPTAHLQLFGINGMAIPPIFVFFNSLLWLGLDFWQLSVLNRRDVTALFLGERGFDQLTEFADEI